MTKERDDLRKEAIDEDSNEKYDEYKRLRNIISGKLEKDEIEHFKTKFTKKIQVQPPSGRMQMIS
jgi:hypothetical protein